MEEKEELKPLEIFAEEASDENVQVQIRAIQKLPTIAVVLDVEATRRELIPFLDHYIESNFLHDEVLYAVAKQLETFLPFVGGPEHIHLILGLLKKLCIADDTLVRERAVQSLVTIVKSMESDSIEKHFVGLIEELAGMEWFTSKCSVSALFEVCYLKVSEEKQSGLRKHFQSLMQDEQPMVRRAAAENFIKFSEVIEKKFLKEEFLPVLDNLIRDTQDSVRVLTVNVALSISSKLTEEEIQELVWKYFEELSSDKAWRVRCQFASNIHSIQTTIGPKLTKQHLIPIFISLAKDDEPQIREEVTRHLVSFCETLHQTCDDFEDTFKSQILEVIQLLHGDFNSHVRSIMASNLMSLVKLVGDEAARKEFVPLVKKSIEQEQIGVVKEELARNLEGLIGVMEVGEVLGCVQKLLEDLIYKSDSNWRTRRNVLLTFVSIGRRCKRQFFNENLRDLYLKLLYDPVYAVRKTAPLVLPVLMKRFGMNWGFFTVEMILPFVDDHNYLYRYIPIFCIKEIINPNLDKNVIDGNIKYLETLKEFCNNEETTKNKALKTLTRLKYYQKLLQKAFEAEWCQELDNQDSDSHIQTDDIKIYAEDLYDVFLTQDTHYILEITKKELEEDELSYLEGTFHLCLKHFLKTLRKLTEDKISNVPVKAWQCLSEIREFSRRVGKELEEDWVLDCLKMLSEEEIKENERAIEVALEENTKKMEENLDFELQNPFERQESENSKSLVNEVVEIFDNKLETIVKDT